MDPPTKDWDGFDWDGGNLLKSWEKQGVSVAECEQVFFNRPLITGEDSAHSDAELRWYALGVTDNGRQLFVVFTIRNNKIRVISARNMSRRERRVFESK